MDRSRGDSGESSYLPVRNTAVAGTPTVGVATTSLPRRPRWPTVDGPLGLSEEESVVYARRFYMFGFLFLPWLWAVNCFYFWPVLRHSGAFPTMRRYIIGSAAGFSVFVVLMSSWSLTFMIGGERLFGDVYNKLLMYNVADEWGLTGWMQAAS